MNKLQNYLFGILAVSILLFTSCTKGSEEYFNVKFGTGDTAGFSSTQQFISVSTESAWTAVIEYNDGGTDWCSISPSSGTGSANVLMTYGRNETDEPRSLRLIFRTSKSSVTLTFTQNAAGESAEHKMWLELPSFVSDQTTYYFGAHMLPSSGNTVRSFSVFYDAEHNIPLWVAYPLCSYYLATGNRTNAWGTYDPAIPQSVQVNLISPYYGYQRGHMLPSASRNKTQTDNIQTFYNTNMTPQLSSLNEEKWATLEGRVRDWSKSCDTLYVVTGAVLKTANGSESISYTTARNDSKKVAIPNYYYKALLQYRNNNGVKTYQALAIWMPHCAASGSITADDIMTIDALEALTGIDFFTNLDATTQQKVEASYNLLYWSGIE